MVNSSSRSMATMGLTPQLSASWLTVLGDGERPMMPMAGRKRAMERTVKPVSDTHTMAATSSSVAARQAAPEMAPQASAKPPT